MQKIKKILISLLTVSIFLVSNTALAVPLSVQQGGTGVGTITGIIQGSGTSNFSPITIGTGLSFIGGTLSATGAGTVTSVSGTTNRITSTGGTTPVIDISGSYVGQSSITTLGTITTGVWNGTAIANANLANSTISGISLGSNLNNLSATNSTLTFSGSYNGGTARTIGLNLGNANTWTGQQTFNTTAPIFGTITGSTQCLHVDTAGLISGTGADCGSGSGGITIGTTAITSGTNGRVLYDNSGVVGEMTTTGSGTVLALATSPSFTTPTLGVASATSINKVAITAPTTSATLTIADGKTLTASDNATVSGTNTGDQTSVSGNAGTATALLNARTLWGQSFDGTGNISGSLTAVGDITGGASNMAITAGTGNSRTLTLKSTTSGGTATAFLTGNADQSSTFGGNISGTSAWNLTGGAGNMTIVSGTGNSRTLTLQTTTSGGTATTALTLAADQSATFANTVNATTFVGALTGNASTATSATSATTATTATNIAGGAGGSIPYQSSANTTALLANGSAGQILRSAGTTAAPIWSTPTFPNTATSGKILVGDGTNIVLSTPTFPNASATSGKTIRSDGTNWITSTATLSDAPSTSLKWLRSDGTNWITSTSTLSDSPSTAGKLLVSDGTNWITSTPTFPNASATSGKIIKSDGTNWVASTETYASPGTSGNVLTSDGTNWTSAAASGGGTSSFVGAITTNSSSTATNTDTTYTSGFQPGMIIIEFQMDSITNGGPQSFMKGRAYYNGTTYVNTYWMYESGTSSTAVTGTTLVFNTDAVKSGTVTGSPTMTVALSVLSVSSTTFVIRATYAGAGGATAHATFFPTAYK